MALKGPTMLFVDHQPVRQDERVNARAWRG